MPTRNYDVLAKENITGFSSASHIATSPVSSISANDCDERWRCGWFDKARWHLLPFVKGPVELPPIRDAPPGCLLRGPVEKLYPARAFH